MLNDINFFDNTMTIGDFRIHIFEQEKESVLKFFKIRF